jgi:hypothetical protein
MSKIKDWMLEEEQRKNEELDKRYQEHDCHASPKDGCAVCDEYKQAHEQREPEPAECSEGICDGSGYITVGQYDDIHEERCACNPKVSMEELMDDNSDQGE